MTWKNCLKKQLFKTGGAGLSERVARAFLAFEFDGIFTIFPSFMLKRVLFRTPHFFLNFLPACCHLFSPSAYLLPDSIKKFLRGSFRIIRNHTFSYPEIPLSNLTKCKSLPTTLMPPLFPLPFLL